MVTNTIHNNIAVTFEEITFDIAFEEKKLLDIDFNVVDYIPNVIRRHSDMDDMPSATNDDHDERYQKKLIYDEKLGSYWVLD